MAEVKTIAIIGAGPVGLAAAAHVLETWHDPRGAGGRSADWPRGAANGAMCNCFRRGNTMSTVPPPVCLARVGWNSPDPALYPTGGELIERYLEPLATRTELKDHIRIASRVTDISRVGFDKLKTRGREVAPFELRYRNGSGTSSLEADAVIDASGTCSRPSCRSQWPARGRRNRDGKQRRLRHARRARRRTGTLSGQDGRGSRRGAFRDRNADRNLARLTEQSPGTQAIWLLRRDNPAKAFGGGANDKLAARGELGKAFELCGSPLDRLQSRLNSGSATSAGTAAGSALAPDRHAAGGTSSPMN